MNTVAGKGLSVNKEAVTREKKKQGAWCNEQGNFPHAPGSLLHAFFPCTLHFSPCPLHFFPRSVPYALSWLLPDAGVLQASTSVAREYMHQALL